jgi:hypothetical protein
VVSISTVRAISLTCRWLSSREASSRRSIRDVIDVTADHTTESPFLCDRQDERLAVGALHYSIDLNPDAPLPEHASSHNAIERAQREPNGG